MKTLKQFIPLRSKSQSKNIACYEAYVRGYKEAENKYKKQLRKIEIELKQKTKPWLLK